MFPYDRGMQPDPIPAVRLLCAADPTTCDRAGLVALVEASRRVRGWLDAFDATIAVCADRLAADELVRDGGRRSAKEADAVARRGEVCELLPDLHAALAAGRVSAGHADALGPCRRRAGRRRPGQAVRARSDDR
jgi:hypothetical protein